ncbi:MAG: rod shape-determining protein MreB [Bacillota bacterium]|nr:rod shape-determining protein MreB [Bacillota bacterium]
MFRLVADVGVDLGTATVLIYVVGKGIVLKEPSVVAIEQDTKRILAIGEEAWRMIGRTPGNIIAIRPLREGVIADYDVTQSMLRHFLSKVCGRGPLARPRIMICVPSGVTGVERRAVLQACAEAGASATFLIEEPLAAALGAGLDIAPPVANMVVDIGGGTTDIAVISLGGVVLSESIRVAGDKFDDAIMRFVRKEHNVLIGERTAEDVKIRVGAAMPGQRDESIEIRGRDLVGGLPKTIRVTSSETAAAMEESVTAICDRVKSILERTPPELAADLTDRGIVLTGGGSLLYGFDTYLSSETHVPVRVADDPVSCVARGTALAFDFLLNPAKKPPGFPMTT